jgi:hypothetical protein
MARASHRLPASDRKSELTHWTSCIWEMHNGLAYGQKRFANSREKSLVERASPPHAGRGVSGGLDPHFVSSEGEAEQERKPKPERERKRETEGERKRGPRRSTTLLFRWGFMRSSVWVSWGLRGRHAKMESSQIQWPDRPRRALTGDSPSNTDIGDRIPMLARAMRRALIGNACKRASQRRKGHADHWDGPATIPSRIRDPGVGGIREVRAKGANGKPARRLAGCPPRVLKTHGRVNCCWLSRHRRSP